MTALLHIAVVALLLLALCVLILMSPDRREVQTKPEPTPEPTFRLLRWTSADYPNVRLLVEITEAGETRTAEFIGWNLWWRHFPSFKRVKASDPVDRWLDAQYARIEYERVKGRIEIEAPKRVGGAS